MSIDNQKNTYRIWLSRLVMTIVFSLIILAIVFLPWFDETEFWLSKYHVAIFISAIYIILNWINFLKRPYFISYNDQGEKIVVRFYPVSMFTSRKNSIEIPKKQFVKYELKPFLFKTQHYLILHQNFRGKVVAYPQISLSALDKEDREKMLESLKKYTSQG
ncbi:MAG: hypothetical protein DRI97_08490 [Bacteroidetes bacterium]|nr:MAG: hypothetical protein DRI97_08490 [Bacteroidota bacterium]